MWVQLTLIDTFSHNSKSCYSYIIYIALNDIYMKNLHEDDIHAIALIVILLIGATLGVLIA